MAEDVRIESNSLDQEEYMFKDWKVLLFGLVILSFCVTGCRSSRWLNPAASCNGPGCGSCADGSCAVSSYGEPTNSMANPGYNTGYAPTTTAAPSSGSGTRSYGGSGTR